MQRGGERVQLLLLDMRLDSHGYEARKSDRIKAAGATFGFLTTLRTSWLLADYSCSASPQVGFFWYKLLELTD